MVTRDAEIDFVSTRVGTQPVEYHELAGASYAIKGVFDRIAAALALVVVAIPMAVIVAIIKLSSPGPALIKQERVGTFATDLVQDFLLAFTNQAGMNLHVNLVQGRNPHHVIEATFKALARALDAATRIDPRVRGVPSTKGSL